MANNELLYKITQIHTTKFSIAELNDKEFEKLFKKPEDLNFGFKTEIKFSEDEEQITIAVDSLLTRKLDTGERETIVEHTGKTQYAVKNIKQYHNKENQAYDLPDNFVIILFTLAYSHARALLAVELSPTPLKDKIFLPVVDPKKLIPKN